MKIFVSYCHDDRHFLKNLEKHLSVLQKKYKIEIFSDRAIQPGDDLHQQIQCNLNGANIVLLLISSGFLASTECQKETQIALKRQLQHGIDVVPIIISPCDWLNSDIAKLKAIPNDGQPISKWKDRNEAYLDVAEGITKVVLNRTICKPRIDFINELQHTGFKSSTKDNVLLDDIFVMPNITETTKRSNIAISDISELSRSHGIALLYGDDLSGKSTICKRLYLDRKNKNCLTLLINGDSIKKYQSRSDIIKRAFLKQYEGSIEAWKESDNRMLIIDNFDTESCGQIVNNHDEICESVLVTMSRNKYIAYCRDQEYLAKARLFDLGHLTHSQQEMLIRKWKESDQPETSNLAINDGSIDRVETILNSVIPNRRVVPRFPFYVLTILQSLEAFGPENLKITTFGHCYYAFLVFQLRASGVSGVEIDSIMNFLSFAAFQRFQNTGKDQVKLNIDQLIRKYRSNFVGGETKIQKFISKATNILLVEDGKIWFRQPYIYYFLLGYYFANNQEDFQLFSADMIANCHTRDNSFALVFTIHHSSDIELIDSLISHAEGLLNNLKVATLDKKETKRLESALESIPKNVLSNKSVDEERRKERDRRDRIEEQEDDDEDNLDGGKIFSALKSIEILAQVVLNKYGSLRRDKCIELVQTICDLAFRIVRIFVSRRMIMMLDQAVSAEIEGESDKAEQESDISAEELSKRLKAIMTYFIYLIVRKAAISIGQFELEEIVHEVCKGKDSTAYWLMFWIYKLNSAEIFDDKICKILVNAIHECSQDRNEVVKRLISLEIQLYLNSHRVDFNIRQTICESLKIEYLPNRSLC